MMVYDHHLQYTIPLAPKHSETQVLYCVMQIPLLFTLGRSEFEIGMSVSSLLCRDTNFSY